MKIDADVLEHGRVLWEYHKKPMQLEHADFILALGSHDTRTAQYATKLFLDGFSDWLIVSGGYGKVTKDAWQMTEGEKFSSIAEDLGVPKHKILVETKAANTGDNFQFSRELLAKENLDLKKGIIVTKPYMSRRAFATGSKQWPEIDWAVTAPPINFEDYPNEEVSLIGMLNLMVGDLQRIAFYPSKGFQVEQEIPTSVWESYHFLVENGFDKFVIKE